MSMVLVLEGGAGRGKTSLANHLHEMLAVPVYRPFRAGIEHIAQDQVTHMRQALGLAVNGWEEDIYTADLLASVPASVILDRSLPSALAFNEASSCPLTARARAYAIRLWSDRMRHARANVVLLTGSEEIRKARRPDRGGEWEEIGIVKALTEMRPHGVNIWTVNTDTASVAELAAAIARRATLGTQSPMIATWS